MSSMITIKLILKVNLQINNKGVIIYSFSVIDYFRRTLYILFIVLDAILYFKNLV